MAKPVLWASRTRHFEGMLPADGQLRESYGSEFRLCASFDLTDTMISQLREQRWVYLVERVRRQRRMARIIIRWREAPPDYDTVNLLLVYIYRTLQGQ